MQLSEPTNILRFRKALLDWFESVRRPLPWRTERTVYRTVVSELMCQQTQIDTALPYFERWTRRFPDFETLAAADPEAVLKHWEGLGYYSRARNLQRLAQAIVAEAEHPGCARDWQKLPGIGPYTAAAIASIHHAEPIAVVDGNVIRVCARLTADERSFKNGAEAGKQLGPVAQSLLNPEQPGAHNEAMMELGALVCRKANPGCLLCPVRDFCAAESNGNAAELPRLQRTKAKEESVERVWVEAEGSILLQRVAAKGSQLQGLYELPMPRELGLSGKGTVLATEKRGIGNRRITESIRYRQADSADLKVAEADSSLIWADAKKLKQLPLSGPHRKWIRKHSAAAAGLNPK